MPNPEDLGTFVALADTGGVSSAFRRVPPPEIDRPPPRPVRDRRAPTLAQFAARHPLLQLHVEFGDRCFDLIGTGLDLTIRIGYLQDSARAARRVGAAALDASPGDVQAHGAPASLEDLQAHRTRTTQAISRTFGSNTTRSHAP